MRLSGYIKMVFTGVMALIGTCGLVAFAIMWASTGNWAFGVAFTLSAANYLHLTLNRLWIMSFTERVIALKGKED